MVLEEEVGGTIFFLGAFPPVDMRAVLFFGLALALAFAFALTLACLFFTFALPSLMTFHPARIAGIR